MKKNLLVYFLVYIGLSSAKLFSASIEVPNITIQNPSTQQIVDVNITCSSEKIFVGYQITLQYNPQILKLIDVTKGPLVGSFTVLVNINTPGIIRIAGFHPMLSGTSGSGILSILRFQILQQGNSNLILSSVKLSDPSGQTIPCSVGSGSIKAGETLQKPEKSQETTPKPDSSPDKTPTAQKSQTTIIPGQEIKPFVPKPIETPWPEAQNLDIDTFLAMQESMDHIETHKEQPQTRPSNSVTLLVFSDFGNPVPPAGITTFVKGEKVNCSVESEVLVSDTEKVVCTGCEGKGSAYNTKNNSISFVIDKDSKIIWKWKKVPVEPGFLIDTPSEINFEFSKKEVSIPVKVRFLGGLTDTIFLETASKFDITFSDTCLTPEKKETSAVIKIHDNFSAGKYSISIYGKTKDKKLQAEKSITVMVPVFAFFGEVSSNETDKLIMIPVMLNGNVKNISSFEIIMEAPEEVKFVRIESMPGIKIMNGFVQKGKYLKISGGLIPPVDIKDRKLFSVILSYSKTPAENQFKPVRVFLWDQHGEKIPTQTQIK
ncbi:MAG: cohesin domain-containing protein [Candidatus Ratteibacteria bacterium]